MSKQPEERSGAPFNDCIGVRQSVLRRKPPVVQIRRFGSHRFHCQAFSNPCSKKGHNEPGFAFERRTSGNLVSPMIPFQVVIGVTSPGGEVSASAFLPSHCFPRRKGTSRPCAPGIWLFCKPHLRSGAVCIFSRIMPVALITFFSLKTG